MVQLILQAGTPAEYALNFARSVIGPANDEEVVARVAGLEADRDLATRVGCAVLQGKTATPEAMCAATAVIAEHKIPTLVSSGGWTAFFDRIGEVTARFTGGRFATFPAKNYMVQDVSAAAFNSMLDEFMRDAEAR